MTTQRKRILVTGANGQLGTELRLLCGDFAHADFLFTDIAELDITDAGAVRQTVDSHNIDTIINCAAYTAVDKAESDPRKAALLNAQAPALLAEAVNSRGGTMIQVSTDYVYNGRNHTPYTEDAPTDPLSVYGSTKLQGELNVLAACPRSIIVRTAWLYSAHGNNFVKTMMRLGMEKSELNVVCDQVGTPTYAGDLARALATIATAPQPVYGVFHYSNEGATSWYDFTKTIHDLAGITACRVNPIPTSQYPAPATRPAYALLDKTKIKQAYGLRIPYWVDSLRKCVAQLQQQDN